MPALILVADDERKMVDLVRGYLEADGFEVVAAYDGARALELFRERRPDCLILDVAMPGAGGFDVAREVRAESSAPIIFLSARADETDRVAGLELGADDYVVKPFSPRELVARVRARLRRPAPADRVDPRMRALRAGSLALDPAKRAAVLDGRAVEHPAAQIHNLLNLPRKPGRVFGRLEILEGAPSAGEPYRGYERTIDAQVKKIRKALGDDHASPRFIRTVRGIGYAFIDAGGGGA